MNPELQYKFEKQMMESDIITDRRLFNKDTKVCYNINVVWWMYRVWVNQEARIENLLSKHKTQVEESFMCGYTEAEFDLKHKVKETIK